MRSHGGFGFQFEIGHISEGPEVNARFKTRRAAVELEAELRKKGFKTTVGKAERVGRHYFLAVRASALHGDEHETHREISRAHYVHVQEEGIPRKAVPGYIHNPRGGWGAQEWKRIAELRRRK